MSMVSQKAFEVLAARQEAVLEKRAAAKLDYAECLLSETAAEEDAARLVAAIKVLGVTSEELGTDVGTLNRLKRIAEQLAAARAVYAGIRQRLEAAEEELRLAERRRHIPSIEILRKRADEVRDEATDSGASIRALTEQAHRERAGSPRVFKPGH